MIRVILKSLEQEWYPLLGPNVLGLKFTGMLLGAKTFRNIVMFTIHILATLFVVSQYIELWLIRSDINGALRNLSLTMLSTTCVLKAWNFVIYQKTWKEIIESVSKLERNELDTKDFSYKMIIDEYTSYSRKVTYFYWSLVTCTVFTVVIAPAAGYLASSDEQSNDNDPYPEIMSCWFPLDRKNIVYYWLSILVQVMVTFYGGGIVATFDSNAVAIMTFFCGQIKMLHMDCVRLCGETGDLSEDAIVANIRKCHEHHVFIVKYSKLFNSLLSPVMFMYIVICSLMICASAIQLTGVATTRMEQIWIAEYLLALVAQLFLYCWHGNEVLVMSEKVDRGVYKSEWWRQRPRVRRCILLLGGQLCKEVVFDAGPFARLTVTTFVAILKGAYSYYAILSKNND